MSQAAAARQKILWQQCGPYRGKQKKKRNRNTVNTSKINMPVLDRNSPRFYSRTSHSPLVSHHSYLSPLPGQLLRTGQLPPLLPPRSPLPITPRPNPITARVYSQDTPIASLAPADPSPSASCRDVTQRDRDEISFPELMLRLVAGLLGRRRSGRHQRNAINLTVYKSILMDKFLHL